MNDVKKLLLFNLSLLLQSVDVLVYSLDKCHKIGIKDNYTMSELNDFEALSSRFARSTDILTQKVLKTLFIAMQEDAPFFIDRCNLSEKLELVNNANELHNIRGLRNQISHEYQLNDLVLIFATVLENSQLLLDIITKVKNYIFALKP